MKNLDADAAKCAKITNRFAAGAAAVAFTSAATAVPAIMQQQVEEERWLAMATARQRSRHVTGKQRNRVSRRRV